MTEAEETQESMPLGDGQAPPAEPGTEPEVTLPVPARPTDGMPADLQTSAQLPALATMSDDDFELVLSGMVKTRTRLKRVHREVMEKDVDYGTIPGTEKPTLLKSGAEILGKMNHCVPLFTRERTVGDGATAPPIAWDSTCYFKDASGGVQAEGSGSCNSWEKKYRYRNAERICPECNAPAIIKGSAKFGGGLICWRKKNGCGARFEDDDSRITEQQVGQVENPDPWDLDNTIKKMSDKRAMVAAALNLQAASGSFTQDLEEDDEGGEPVEPKATQRGKKGARKGANGGVGEKINEGQRTLLLGKASKRARELGLDQPDAGQTLLNTVLKEGGIKGAEKVQVGQMNEVLQAIESYEFPGA